MPLFVTNSEQAITLARCADSRCIAALEASRMLHAGSADFQKMFGFRNTPPKNADLRPKSALSTTLSPLPRLVTFVILQP